MMSDGSIGNIIGIIGHVFSIAIFLFPLPTIKTICKKKTVEQDLPILYLATLMNCMIWFLYGMPFVHPNRILVLSINGIGIFIEAVYIVIFLVFASRSQRVKIIGIFMTELLLIGITLAAVLGRAQSHDERTKIVGPLCSFFGTIMYALPAIPEMRMVIKKRSVEFVSFEFYILGLLNVMCWLCYSVFHWDCYMLIPNFVGFAFIGLVQSNIYGYYQEMPQQNVELPKVSPSSAPDTLSSIQVEK